MIYNVDSVGPVLIETQADSDVLAIVFPTTKDSYRVPMNRDAAVRLMNDLELAVRELEEHHHFARCTVCGAPVKAGEAICDDGTCYQIALAEEDALRAGDVREDR